MSNLKILYTTFSSLEEAEREVLPLVEGGLAACANMFPMQSIYRYAGQLRRDSEVAVWLKTTPAGLKRLREALKATHPYEVPCLLHWKVSANSSYRQWVADMLGPERQDTTSA